MLKSDQSLSLLNGHHTFPGAFVFKVIGANTQQYATEASAAIAKVLGYSTTTPQRRASAQGKHQALTFTVHTTCAEQVIEIFAALRDAPGTRWVL